MENRDFSNSFPDGSRGFRREVLGRNPNNSYPGPPFAEDSVPGGECQKRISRYNCVGTRRQKKQEKVNEFMPGREELKSKGISLETV